MPVCLYLSAGLSTLLAKYHYNYSCAIYIKPASISLLNKQYADFLSYLANRMDGQRVFPIPHFAPQQETISIFNRSWQTAWIIPEMSSLCPCLQTCVISEPHRHNCAGAVMIHMIM